VKLPVVDRIQSQRNKFVTGVENEATGNSKPDDSPQMVKPGGPNRPHSLSVCPIPSP